MSAKNIAPALRVAQLDTSELDDNVMQLLSSQMKSCFKYRLANFDLFHIEPHLSTFMYGLLLYNTLWKKRQTIGQKLLRLRYGDQKTLGAPSKRRLLFLQMVLAVSYWIKSTKHFGSNYFSNLPGIGFASKIFGSFFNLLSLLNLMVFLREGYFHTLILRIAGLRTVYVDPNPAQRNISFELMSRDLLWQGFAETGVFFLSLISISKLRRKFMQFIHPANETGDQEVLDSCAFCKTFPMMPYEGSCKLHVYCYYCVSSALIEDENVKCPSCNVAIERVEPLRTQTHAVVEI